jgi:hypothetical protein
VMDAVRKGDYEYSRACASSLLLQNAAGPYRRAHYSFR